MIDEIKKQNLLIAKIKNNNKNVIEDLSEYYDECKLSYLTREFSNKALIESIKNNNSEVFHYILPLVKSSYVIKKAIETSHKYQRWELLAVLEDIINKLD